MNKKTLEFNITVAWGEMDAFGHVNNVQYIRYFETARVRFFEALFDKPWDYQQDVKPVVANISCTYKKPITYPDELRLRVWVEELGNASMLMKCEIHSEKVGLAAIAECTLVYVDFSKQIPVRIPDYLREQLHQA